MIRLPLAEDMMPEEACYDAIIDILKAEPASTPVVFSCQMGKGRTSVGITVALLIKEIQLTAQLRSLSACPSENTEKTCLKIFDLISYHNR